MIAGLERQTINLDPYYKKKYNLFYDALLLRITITIYCKSLFRRSTKIIKKHNILQ